MTLTTTIDGAKATIAIGGWLNAKTAPEFAKALEELDSSVKEIVMDFAELEYISSAGLRQLVAANRKTDGHLTIMNVPTDVMAMFELAGFSQLARFV